MARPTRVDTHEELLTAIGAPRPGGRAIALVGGADLLAGSARETMTGFFRTFVAALEAAGCAVVDGGTDSGVMRLIAEARRTARASFRLIGVAPRGRIDRPTRAGTIVRLATGHTDLVLVPGESFGDETPWLFRAADHLAGGRAPTVVVNGGRLTLGEAIRRLTTGAPVVTVAGSGRAAEVLADAARAGGRLGPGSATGGGDGDELGPYPVETVDVARLRVVGLDASIDGLTAALWAPVEEG